MPTLRRKETVYEKDGAFGEAHENVQSMGLDLPRRPGERMPEVPFALGDATDDQLMDLFGQFTQWAAYAAVRVAEAETVEEELEASLKLQEARYMAAETSNGAKVTAIRAQRDSDEDISTIRTQLRKAKAVRRLVEALYANANAAAALMSRELSRRLGSAPTQGRAAKYG